MLAHGAQGRRRRVPQGPPARRRRSRPPARGRGRDGGRRPARRGRRAPRTWRRGGSRPWSAGAGIEVANAFTGRANLHATRTRRAGGRPRRGSTASTRIDEAVTLATLPEHAVVDPRPDGGHGQDHPVRDPRRDCSSAAARCSAAGPLAAGGAVPALARAADPDRAAQRRRQGAGQDRPDHARPHRRRRRRAASARRAAPMNRRHWPPRSRRRSPPAATCC